MVESRAVRAARVAQDMRQEYVSELEAAMASLRRDLETATQYAASLQAKVDAEAAGRAQAVQELATARGEREGLLAQLARERAVCANLNDRLNQAIAGLATRAPEAPFGWRMVVESKDQNERMRSLVARPLKEGEK